MHRLIREDDRAVYGDKGYASEKKRAAEGAGILWAVKEKAKPGRELTKRQRARSRRFGRVRAKVEHVFRVLKCQFGFARCAIAASPRTARRCSRSWPSPISTSSAPDLRPQREGGGLALHD
jgi:transposase, IS5 family